MVDEKAWAAIRVFVVGVVAAVLLLGEIRDGMRGAR